MPNGDPDDDHSIEKQASTAKTTSSGNAAASDMGPNAISINIGGQGWGVGRAPSSSSGQGSRGGQPSSGDDTTNPDGFGDFDNYPSPVVGYSLLSGSRAGGRRTKKKKRKRRTRHKKTKKKTKHRRRKRRKRRHRRTRRKHHSRRRRRKRRRRRQFSKALL